jgi:hypothetical protein
MSASASTTVAPSTTHSTQRPSNFIPLPPELDDDLSRVRQQIRAISSQIYHLQYDRSGRRGGHPDPMTPERTAQIETHRARLRVLYAEDARLDPETARRPIPRPR